MLLISVSILQWNFFCIHHKIDCWSCTFCRHKAIIHLCYCTTYMQHGEWQHFNQIVMCPLGKSTPVYTSYPLMVNKGLAAPSHSPLPIVLLCSACSYVSEVTCMCFGMSWNYCACRQWIQPYVINQCAWCRAFLGTQVVYIFLLSLLTFLRIFFQGLVIPHWVYEHWKYLVYWCSFLEQRPF